MMDDLHLDWTDAQWNEWVDRTVTISLELFDALKTAAEALAMGLRPGPANRTEWQRIAKECNDIIEPEEKAIAALVTPDA